MSNQRCCVCGEEDHIWLLGDASGWFFFCSDHVHRLSRNATATFKEQIEALIAERDSPAKFDMSDTAFLRGCGIKPVEQWEWDSIRNRSRWSKKDDL